VLQALAGLGAALWRSTRRPRRGVDLTDLTGLSRSDFTQAHKAQRRNTPAPVVSPLEWKTIKGWRLSAPTHERQPSTAKP
jgi:hypothetical protein